MAEEKRGETMNLNERAARWVVRNFYMKKRDVVFSLDKQLWIAVLGKHAWLAGYRACRDDKGKEARLK
jgi:hypothetical protein